ncbi:MAG: type II toxin-antitoxin system prevent-host-death family antitoxin [Spirochaetes bacterium]|jgi:prevent-host-death family protein|nr:type II toxin-antitoxin system prevent-host-death family antitoxin [Spirochaetota bacterium]
METISVSELKAHLSGELRKVKSGARIVVLEHKRPVAVLAPYEEETLIAREAAEPYEYRDLNSLTDVDPATLLEAEREDRW